LSLRKKHFLKKADIMKRNMTIVLSGIAALFINGCSVNGKVVDFSQVETPLNNMHLEENPCLKIYHGGAVREIPLKSISSVSIDPSSSKTIENELFYSGEVILVNGGRITSQKENKAAVFVSVQNMLVGTNKGESFKIGLENVSRIMINDKK
jgi:hypothetical protein